MFFFRPLPWDYGVRNLLRRPGRSLLTLLGLATVVFLVLVVTAFVQGLEASLATSGDPKVVLIHSLGAAENIENSSVAGRTPSLLSASLQKIDGRFGTKYISAELYLGTEVGTEDDPTASMGLVRGVTPTAPLVRRQFQILVGRWPGPGQVVIGKLVPTKLGRNPGDLAIGRKLTFEGRAWEISGVFEAMGGAFESELWCPVEDLQAAMKRQDLSLVALSLADASAVADVEEFCKERLDLELQATPELQYYAGLQAHYRPVRTVAWLVVGLVAAAGVFAGLNTMFGAVVGRVREMAALQTMGFLRRAIALSLIQEAALLATTASIVAVALALVLLNGTAVRFTMGAFALRVDSFAVFVGLSTGLFIGVAGAIPPALRAMRIPIVDGLKAI